jgi:2-keto-3-deoxy-L-fuconate dehydrogenase
MSTARRRVNSIIMAILKGKTALVTCAGEYMGPAIAAAFEREGASVIRDHGASYSDNDIRALIRSLVPDILVANLASPPRTASVDSIDDQDWRLLFDRLVDPLMRLVRSVAGPMKERGHGKIIAVTSAAPLRGIPHASAYCAARGAQNSFLRAVGLELAKYNVQVNAIAQNYVRNATYYPDEALEKEAFKRHLQQLVPSKKVATGEETAQLALYLAGPHCTHMVGQVLPLAGGWTTTTG